MKVLARLMFVFMLMIVAVPVYSGDAVQMWKCEMEEGVTEDEVQALATEWLAMAREVPGGEQLNAFVYFPIAVNATGEVDLMFIVVAPSFEEWGRFWDNYAGSDAAKKENQNLEFIVCPDSVVWESIEVK